MKITSVRVSKLVSGPGYENQSVAVEAIVEDDEDAEEVRERLARWVENQIWVEKGHQKLERDYAWIAGQIAELEIQRGRLQAEVEKNRKIIADHEELGSLAKENGLDLHGLPDGDLPF